LRKTRFILRAARPIVLCLVSFAAQAYATDFQATGLFTDGSTLGGTLTIDTNVGTVTASDLTISGAGTFSTLVFQFNYGAPAFYSVIADNTAGTEEFSFGLLADSLVGYTGGDFCGDSNGGSCLSSVFYPTSDPSNQVSLSNGSLTGTSGVAPEPAALSFLGTAFAVGLMFHYGSRKRNGSSVKE